MIPQLIFKVTTDVLVSGVVAYFVRRFIDKLSKRTVDKAIDKAVEKTIEASKSAVLSIHKKKKEEALSNEKEASQKVIEIAEKSIKNSPIDEDSFLKYCVLISYAYGKYGDESLLKILLEKNCIEKEDLEIMAEEYLNLKEKENKYEKK